MALISDQNVDVVRFIPEGKGHGFEGKVVLQLGRLSLQHRDGSVKLVGTRCSTVRTQGQKSHRKSERRKQNAAMGLMPGQLRLRWMASRRDIQGSRITLRGSGYSDNVRLLQQPWGGSTAKQGAAKKQSKCMRS